MSAVADEFVLGVDLDGVCGDHDAAFRQVVAEAGHYLGIAVACLVSTLNVQQVLLAGNVTRLGPPLLEVVQQETGRHALGTLAQNTQVAFGRFGLDVVIWGASALLLAVAFAWQATSPATPLPTHTYECTFCIVLVALLPAAWYFLGIRRFASTRYRWAGSIVLLSALSIGALWLRLSEPNDSIVHVIQWHYLPMLGFGLAGLWLGKLILKW